MLGGVGMTERRRQYDRDFKLSAVRLLAESKRPVSEVARGLDIHESMLRKWRKQVEERGEDSFDESGRQEMSDRLRLERENRRLKRDLEMLKKTLGYLESRKR
jgi:transposase